MSNAQNFPQRAGGAGMSGGHIYGKVVDNNNKPVAGATILLTANRFDTVEKKLVPRVVAPQISGGNGDFSFENVPVMGKLVMVITAVGFQEKRDTVDFGFGSMRRGGDSANKQSAQDRMQQMAAKLDKDLGNLQMITSTSTLGTVTVTSSKPFFEMGVDRKVFNVDKNIVSQGQTATEVMKQIPSVNVDIDGNVTVRNSSPQLFIDDRPTTLTYDQIPSDLIDRVELITNPSAKYDASGGTGGIINIVLKKNKRTGYNGGLRAGIDTRGKFNGGGDLNLRQNKINFFLSGNYNQRKSISDIESNRTNFTDPPSIVTQDGKQIRNGTFAFVRTGIDYFMDNHNTFTISGSYVHGDFNNSQNQLIDSTINNVYTSFSNSLNSSKFQFTNYGAELAYKHNFKKQGEVLSADFNLNGSNNKNNNNINTSTFNIDNSPKYQPYLQQTEGNGKNNYFTFQTDYENQVTEKMKLELGARAAIRDFSNDNNQYYYDYGTSSYQYNPLISSSYSFTDQVYAAYATYTYKAEKWNYQAGLRAESSKYNGNRTDKLANSDSAFNVNYPISLFPSVFITHTLSEKQDLQLNYSRRINRPSFFQLIPFYDYSDPQNPSVGNAGLTPEFTNSFEFSYNNAYKKGANFLATAYYRYNNNLITRNQYKAPNTSTTEDLQDSVIFNTYINANNSYSYGLELTNKIVLFKIWDLTANINLYNSKINVQDSALGNTDSRISWFGKLNNNFTLPAGFTVQLSADYQAKTILPPGGNSGGGFRGGFGGNIGNAQGYIASHYEIEAAIKKDVRWKNGNTLSITASINDIFGTDYQKNHTESIYFVQDYQRLRDPHLVRLNLSYRFGKFDATLFKRKNNKSLQGGDNGASDMMGGG